MFTFVIANRLQKKIKKLAKRDQSLHRNFNRKLLEIINRDVLTIDFYKNLKSPQNEYKRVHSTGNYILLFTVDKENNHIMFVDIRHRDDAYEDL